MTRFQKALLTCLLSFFATAPSTLAGSGETPPPVDPLAARISVDLEEAAAADVLQMFAQISEAELDLAPGVEGKVTLRLHNVTARTALNATCESIGCRCEIHSGRLVVLPDGPAAGPIEAPELDARINLDIKEADAAEVFRTSADLLGATLGMDAQVAGRVTLRVEDRPLREVFDLLCAQLSCRWELEGEVATPVLRVTPR